jgi:hypothetical protein
MVDSIVSPVVNPMLSPVVSPMVVATVRPGDARAPGITFPRATGRVRCCSCFV